MARHERPVEPEAAERFDRRHIADQIRTLLVDGRLDTAKPYAVTLIDGGEPASVIGDSVEYDVFYNTYGNDMKTWQEEFEPYREHSSLIVAIDTRQLAPAGVIRLGHSKPEKPTKLKTIHDVARPLDTTKPDDYWEEDMIAHINQLPGQAGKDPISVENIVDVITLAVPDGYRRKSGVANVSRAVTRASILFIVNKGYHHAVAIMDRGAFAVIRDGFDSPIDRLPTLPERTYLDAPKSSPLFGDLREYFERIAQDSSRSDLYEFLRSGKVSGQTNQDVTTIAEIDRLAL